LVNKVAGLFKGFFSKASQKVQSSLLKKNYRNNRERTRSLQQPVFTEKITLADDPEEYMRKDSMYHGNMSDLMQSQMNYDPIVGKLIPNSSRGDVSRSVIVNSPHEYRKATASPENKKEIEYEEDSPHEKMVQDKEPSILEKIQETTSDDEALQEIEDPKKSIGAIIQESLDASKGRELSDGSTEAKAQEIVDQIKDILAKQFEKQLLAEKDTHFGVK